MKEEQPTATVHDFPCASCGSSMTYSPEVGGLFCAYCKREEAIVAPMETVGETLYDPDADALSAPDWERLGSYTLVCDSCGAEILTSKKAHTARCPFCNTPYVTEPAFLEAVIPPRAMLPFTVSAECAKNAFSLWARKRWLAPFGFRKKVKLSGDFRGVYLPAFTYDTDLSTAYHGEGGRRTTKTYTTRVNGKTVTRTKTVIRWYPIRGVTEESLDDILIPADRAVDTKLFQKISPYSTKVMRPYHPAFLAGFTAERYSLGTRETFETAKGVAESSIERKIRQSEGYDEYRGMHYDHTYHRVAVKHILLPVWFLSYLHKGKRYALLVNGETARVAGRYPLSVLKIAGLVLLGIAAVAALAWLFVNYGG